MALNSVAKWQRSVDYAEQPLVNALKNAGIDAELYNNDPDKANSKYKIDIIVNSPYQMLLEAKLEETVQRNSKDMVGIESEDCLRFDQEDIARYYGEQTISKLPVWIGIRTGGDFSPGWYFIPLIIFNQLKHGGIKGSIKVYPEKAKNIFYCVDKRRCLTLEQFINYLKGTDGERRIIDNEIISNFCNPNFF